MASEDVIELGSSDEESEPAPKKMRPAPNAMVHIPTNLHGVTIKPTKKNSPLHRQVSIKSIPMKSIPTKSMPTKPMPTKPILTKPAPIKCLPTKSAPTKPLLAKSMPECRIRKIEANTLAFVNTKTTKKPIPKTFIKKPVQIQPCTSINPLSVIKKLSNSQIKINKIPCNPLPINIRKPASILSPKLPPSITITKTTGVKRPAPNTISNAVKKKSNPIIKNNVVGEVLTVELDDDEVTPGTSSPQWYLRPDNKKNVDSLEDKNNEEPESTNFVEITIEDSPVKPVLNKRTCEIGTELAITIEDSPVKVVADKENSESGSDDDEKSITRIPQSKKKLEYTKKPSTESIEIEIEPMEINTINIDAKSKDDGTVTYEVKLSDSKESETNDEDKIISKECQAPSQTSQEQEKQTSKDKISGEFHPVYQKFIDVCFELENSEDMTKIVEKKIKTYYRQVPKEYTESEDFIDLVSSKIQAMKAGPQKMYLYIKDVVDELNLQRKMAKSQPPEKEIEEAPEKFSYAKCDEYDSKRQRQIRKLEKTIKKLHRAIQKLEEQEVDFDDDEDSVYLLTERYKERMVRVYKKFCQLTNTKMPSEPYIRIEARPGQPTGPIKRLEKWINKKVPMGTPLPFPDFHDVLRCVKDANNEDDLGWNDAEVMDQARDLFTRCGKKLQRRRQENEWRIAISRVSADVDPAENSSVLQKKLEDNRQLAAKKETDVFNKYADRQKLLKLEGEEIGDKEAEESPVESEDDESNYDKEDTLLQNKEKRKERLRRLLQEKSKKNTSDESETVSISKSKERDISGNTKAEEDLDNIEKQAHVTDIDMKEKEPDSMNVVDKEKDSNIEDAENNEKETKNAVTNDVDNKAAVKDKDSDKVHSLSDDSEKVESDIDELHLLQKLHSENEISSSAQESSDSESPIAISDTLDSGSDLENREKLDSDVISIENSSYSESENNKLDDIEEIIEAEKDHIPQKEIIGEIVDGSVDIECSTGGIKEEDCTTITKHSDNIIDDVLLPSSDDETNLEVVPSNSCVELSKKIKNDSLIIEDNEKECFKVTTSETDPDKPNNIIDDVVLASSDDDNNSAEKCESREGSEASVETTVNLKDNSVLVVDNVGVVYSKVDVKQINQEIIDDPHKIIDDVLLALTEGESMPSAINEEINSKDSAKNESPVNENQTSSQYSDRESNKIIEDVLLASSDEEANSSFVDNQLSTKHSLNIKQDNNLQINGYIAGLKSKDSEIVNKNKDEMEMKTNADATCNSLTTETTVKNDCPLPVADKNIDECVSEDSTSSMTEKSKNKDFTEIIDTSPEEVKIIENDFSLNESVKQTNDPHKENVDLISINSIEELIDDDCKILEKNYECDSVESLQSLQDDLVQKTGESIDDIVGNDSKQNKFQENSCKTSEGVTTKEAELQEKKDFNIDIAEESNSLDFLEICSVEELDCISINNTACNSVETTEVNSVETMETNSVEECNSTDSVECSSVDAAEVRSEEIKDCDISDDITNKANKSNSEKSVDKIQSTQSGVGVKDIEVIGNTNNVEKNSMETKGNINEVTASKLSNETIHQDVETMVCSDIIECSSGEAMECSSVEETEFNNTDDVDCSSLEPKKYICETVKPHNVETVNLLNEEYFITSHKDKNIEENVDKTDESELIVNHDQVVKENSKHK